MVAVDDFLGFAIEGGVEDEMARRLLAVGNELRAVHRSQRGRGEDFRTWCGIKQSHKGFHPGGHHGRGIAVDMNYDTNPYIATRTGTTYGGEAGFLDADARRGRAVEVYDRAVAFTFTEGETADVSIRVSDSIEYTYDRFRAASDCLGYYLSHAFQWGDNRVWVDRAPIGHAHELPDGDAAFAGISAERELNSYDDAIALLTETMTAADTSGRSPSWADLHPTWPWPTAEAQYWQILRDYEAVRTPMLQGSSSADPIRRTRNPANGFLDLRRELVVSMVKTGGMVWGACDFGAGGSGDMMHFDYGPH